MTVPTSDLYSFVCIILMSYVIKTGCFAEVRKLKKMNSRQGYFKNLNRISKFLSNHISFETQEEGSKNKPVTVSFAISKVI